MPAINSTQQLAKIRSQIDEQQQVVAWLEMEMQKALLGDVTTLTRTGPGNAIDTIKGIYSDAYLETSFEKGMQKFGNENDETWIRHALYMARAMLGELRIEEQHWNTEVQEEKARRKDLLDFAKG